MGLGTIFKNIFGTKKTAEGNANMPELVEQIRTSMSLLVQKSDSLNESWEKEKLELKDIFAQVQHFVPETEILSAKYEQDILGQITAVSSACDGVIAGRPHVELMPLIQTLHTSVRQRAGMKGSD